ncbi:MAG: WXG100 family type VII secretion target [Bacilli bacterium]|nr:WXG100 family type VII secretion target [Bacilli bacterium]
MNESLKYSELRSISGNLKTYTASMKQIFSDITNAFNEVGGQNWEGDAAESMRAKLNQVSAKFDEFYSAVKSEYEFLDNYITDNEAIDSKIMG